MVCPRFRKGEGFSLRANTSPIFVRGKIALPSPAISAFTRVFDALWGEGAITSTASAASISLQAHLRATTKRVP